MEKEENKCMKKKWVMLLLIVLIMPIVALFGCDEVSLYSVSVFTSSSKYGKVMLNNSSSGSGTFSEGSTITLTATTLNGSSFICWAYQNSVEIANDSTYKITNTTDSDNKTTKSVLTFSINSTTQGNYTAIFSDGEMMYTQFQSMRITSTPDEDGEADDLSKQPIMSGTVSVAQGYSSSTLYTSCQWQGLEIKDNVNIYPEDVSSLLYLAAPPTNRQIVATTQFEYENHSVSITFRAGISYKTNKAWTTESNYSYKIDYADGVYKITFKFNVSTDMSYYLILNYAELAPSQPSTQIL